MVDLNGGHEVCEWGRGGGRMVQCGINRVVHNLCATFTSLILTYLLEWYTKIYSDENSTTSVYFNYIPVYGIY